jgi:hypothetical protein
VHSELLINVWERNWRIKVGVLLGLLSLLNSNLTTDENDTIRTFLTTVFMCCDEPIDTACLLAQEVAGRSACV